MLPYTPGIVAEAILDHLDQAVIRRGTASLAIPGGRSPGAVLTELARLCPARIRDALHLYWLDERAVPRGHPDRNDQPTLAAWDAGGPRPGQVHRMPAEGDDLEAAAHAYVALLPQVLDVCLIGVGEDGHLASLFPGHPGLRELSPVFAVRDSPKPPACRLTLGLGVIAAARWRAVLCLGAAKAAVYRAAQGTPDAACPVSFLPRNDTVWFLDDAAVGGLKAEG